MPKFQLYICGDDSIILFRTAEGLLKVKYESKYTEYKVELDKENIRCWNEDIYLPAVSKSPKV